MRSPILHLQIVRGTGLLKADYFGLSDPYCVVYFNDKEVGRTPIVPDNLDPEWEGRFLHTVVLSHPLFRRWQRRRGAVRFYCFSFGFLNSSYVSSRETMF